jgi:hypothetical protein
VSSDRRHFRIWDVVKIQKKFAINSLFLCCLSYQRLSIPLEQRLDEVLKIHSRGMPIAHWSRTHRFDPRKICCGTASLPPSLARSSQYKFNSNKYITSKVLQITNLSLSFIGFLSKSRQQIHRPQLGLKRLRNDYPPR